MSQPFYQPARQNFSSSQSMQQPQGGFGGFGGGYQMPQQSFGGGFGGGYGSGFGFGGGFQPSFGGGFGGGYGGGFSGGFQPQGFGGFGGFGGGFNPYQGGFGGGYNPMFGGIGGLGFNPMMGPQFGMPMQGMRDPRVDMLGQQFGFASEEPMRAIHQLQSGLTPLQPQQQPQQPADTSQDAFIKSPEYKEWQKQAQFTSGVPYDAAYKNWQKSQPVQPATDTQSAISMEEQARRLAKGPMYGGLGSLGFNPMMGPQFGMPMGGFDPYQQQMRQHQQFLEQRDQSLAPTWQAAQQARQQNPAYAQLQQLQSQFRDKNPNFEELKQINDLQNQIDSDPAFIKAKNAHENAVQQFQAQRQPMYGGIGGLGFNPMMGPQFGMPMQGFNPYQQQVQFQPQMTAESAADINRAREQRENMQMQNIRSNWSQAGQGATSGMDFLQRLQGLSGGSYVPLSDEQMRLERDARLYSMTPQQRAMAQG